MSRSLQAHLLPPAWCNHPHVGLLVHFNTTKFCIQIPGCLKHQFHLLLFLKNKILRCSCILSTPTYPWLAQQQQQEHMWSTSYHWSPTCLIHTKITSGHHSTPKFWTLMTLKHLAALLALCRIPISCCWVPPWPLSQPPLWWRVWAQYLKFKDDEKDPKAVQ